MPMAWTFITNFQNFKENKTATTHFQTLCLFINIETHTFYNFQNKQQTCVVSRQQTCAVVKQQTCAVLKQLCSPWWGDCSTDLSTLVQTLPKGTLLHNVCRKQCKEFCPKAAVASTDIGADVDLSDLVPVFYRKGSAHAADPGRVGGAGGGPS